MIKNEKGSVTLIVVATVLFILIVLSASLMFVSTKRKAQLQESQILQNVYGGDLYDTYQGQAEKYLSALDITANPKQYYGAYVKYGVDLNGDEDYTNDWRLFYVGGAEDGQANGRMYIIAADYVPMSNTTLQEAMGDANNGARMFPASSSSYVALSAYWGSSAPANQNVSEDTMKLFMHTGYNISDASKKDNRNSCATSTLLNTDNWDGFVNGDYYGQAAIGGPTLEMWCAAWNAVVDESDENSLKKMYANGNETKGNGYYWGTSKDTTNSNSMYMNGTSSSMKKLTKLGNDYPVFFPHTTSSVTANGVSGNCYGYWLASPSANYTRYVMNVYYGGSVRYDDCSSSFGFGLRPLVCLQSEVQLQKNNAESTEEKTVYDIVK